MLPSGAPGPPFYSANNSDINAMLVVHLCCQAKKKHYDMELENLEKHQKQTIEKMEENHAVKLKDETKRIKTEQERDYHKFQDQLKHRKKEVGGAQETWEGSCSVSLLKVQ